MSHKKGIEAVNNCLNDLKKFKRIIRRVIVLLPGDFRQTLTDVPRGTRPNEVAACIKSSYLWHRIQKLALTKNMRVQLKGGKTDAHIFLNFC